MEEERGRVCGKRQSIEYDEEKEEENKKEEEDKKERNCWQDIQILK